MNESMISINDLNKPKVTYLTRRFRYIYKLISQQSVVFQPESQVYLHLRNAKTRNAKTQFSHRIVIIIILCIYISKTNYAWVWPARDGTCREFLIVWQPKKMWPESWDINVFNSNKNHPNQCFSVVHHKSLCQWEIRFLIPPMFGDTPDSCNTTTNANIEK